MDLINKSTHQSDMASHETKSAEEEMLDRIHSDSILSSLHENEYSGKFTNKNLWQKFEDFVWYNGHRHFEELAHNGVSRDKRVIRAIRLVLLSLLASMWMILYYNVVIHSGKSFAHFFSLITFFTQWGMFFTTF